MKKLGYQARMVDFAKVAAYPKAGAIGIRLRIIHPDVVFPDKIDAEKAGLQIIDRHEFSVLIQIGITIQAKQSVHTNVQACPVCEIVPTASS